MLFVHVGGVSIPPALLSRYHHSHTASIHRSTINPLAPTAAPCNSSTLNQPHLCLSEVVATLDLGQRETHVSHLRHLRHLWDTCISFETPLGHFETLLETPVSTIAKILQIE